MNIFEHHLAEIKKIIISKKNFLKLDQVDNFKGVNLEVPPDHFNFDLSCNIAMVLGKKNKLNPKSLALNLKDIFLNEISNFTEIDIAGPGFLNIKLSKSALLNNINLILDDNTYGSIDNSESYNIEFVSANPTGPMHVGHCRGAIYGDVLANLLKFNGNKVTKEYYINDYGGQIQNFVESVFLRIIEIKNKKKFPKKENLYPGIYIKDIAEKIIKENLNLDFNDFKKIFEDLKKKSLKISMEMIKKDLKLLGISHDNFFSETDIVNKNLVNKAVIKLKEKKFVDEGYLNPPKGESSKDWKKIKRLIFKSTLFGDDTDRALQKNDGTWTYFANDVAYHMDKINRKYKNLVNILGADHTGYIKRITAAVSALSENKIKLNCKVCQLVKLYKNGEPYKMSKRAGEFISAQDLLNEVEKDQIRFMMLYRSNDVELDFDFDKVKEKNKDNPVFYVQYAYARINSLLRAVNINMFKKVNFDENKISFNDMEEKIIRKIFEWPKVIESTTRKFDLHKIPFYLYEISTLFHAYWSKGNEDKNYKFIENERIKRKEILLVINLVALVIQNGMGILGVSLPKRM
ncbi:MAG: arginine--tRNA ligase [Candidatus Pelagibacter sp. TMED286]|nr:MAG: arginine--tRNA ligase [Candidatus Pelagibacter sp. TMED286]|tara:strand:+ start:1060 stop:2781 length:1722 start_codon:yes stop_codon:yes gene_type:complete